MTARRAARSRPPVAVETPTPSRERAAVRFGLVPRCYRCRKVEGTHAVVCDGCAPVVLANIARTGNPAGATHRPPRHRDEP